jgi:hypothetical protein
MKAKAHHLLKVLQMLLQKVQEQRAKMLLLLMESMGILLFLNFILFPVGSHIEEVFPH